MLAIKNATRKKKIVILASAGFLELELRVDVRVARWFIFKQKIPIWVNF
jgi:hypothetical protein